MEGSGKHALSGSAPKWAEMSVFGAIFSPITNQSEALVKLIYSHIHSKVGEPYYRFMTVKYTFSYTTITKASQ